MSQMAARPGVEGRICAPTPQEHMQRQHAGRQSCCRQAWTCWRRQACPSRPCYVTAASSTRSIEETQAGHYDLVVIGAFRATGWDRLMLSDQAHAILPGTHQSLLVV